MAALCSQLFKDPECWSGRGLNLRPPAQQTGALQTELTRRWFFLNESGHGMDAFISTRMLLTILAAWKS